MSDVGDALGTVVEGGLYAKAIDGARDQGGNDSTPLHRGHFTEDACLNCATPLIGSHCHECGQRAHIHRTLAAFFHDLLHGVLHFEGKTWRTLPMLIWHPGRLTRDYIDGARARFVSPIALFLFVVFISFATFQMLGGASALTADLDVEVDARESVEKEFASTTQLLEKRRAKLAELEADAAEATDGGDDGDARRIESVSEDVADLEKEQAALAGALKLMGSELDVDSVEAPEPVEVEVETRSAWQKAKDNPQLLAYKLQTNAYKFAWLLIPISVPFVWLLYLGKWQFRVYDHTIFTTYSITFMLALAGLSGLLIYASRFEQLAGLAVVGSLLPFYAPVHMYRQLRGAYASSRIGAFLRMLLLSAFAWVAIGLFGVVIGTMM